MLWTVIGFIAATLTMFSFIPQIIKALQTRSVKDMSLVTLFQLSLGVLLWIVYGIHLKSPVIIMANSVTLITLVILLCFYFNYERIK